METKIKVGDIVQVTDWGCMYDVNKPWFMGHKNELKTDWLIRYAYGDREKYEQCQHTDDDPYIVLYIDEQGKKALISLCVADTKVYLIDLDATALVRVMTMEQVVKEFGYRIKIVKS